MSSFMDTLDSLCYEGNAGVNSAIDCRMGEDELIEAVNEIALKVSTSVWQEIVSEFQDALTYILDWVYTLFPLFLEYAQGTRSFTSDLETLAIFFVFYVLAIVIFSPRWSFQKVNQDYYHASRRKQQQQQQQQQQHQQQQQQQQHRIRPRRRKKQQQSEHELVANLPPQIQQRLERMSSRHSIGGLPVESHLLYRSKSFLQLTSSTCSNPSSPMQIMFPSRAATAATATTTTTTDTLSPETDSYNNNNNNNNYSYNNPQYYYDPDGYDDLSLLEWETDEQRFQKMWPQLVMAAKYRKLVLPPTCRSIFSLDVKEKKELEQQKKEQQDREKNNQQQQQQQQQDRKQKRRKQQRRQQTTSKQKHKKKHAEDENPADRLINYARQLWYFVRSILSYDYTRAGWTLIEWLQILQRIQQYRLKGRSNPNPDEEEEEDEEDEEEEEEDEDDDEEEEEEDAEEDHRKESLNDTIGDDAEEYTLALETHTDENDKQQEQLNTSSNELAIVKSNEHEEEEEKKDNSCENNVHSEVSTQKEEDVKNLDKSFAKDENKEIKLNGYPPPHDNIVFDNHHNNVWEDIVEDENCDPDKNKEDTFSEKDTEDDEEEESQTEQDSALLQQDDHFFDTAHSREALAEKTVYLPDKHGYILSDELLPDPRNYTPLLVFVNSRSGPQQGHILITQLRRLLNPVQVWDLADGGPEQILESFSVFSRLRVLVCGGDGTVAWIISALEKSDVYNNRTPNNNNNNNNNNDKHKTKASTAMTTATATTPVPHRTSRKIQWPPIAILPLGTGNDLARIHGWGGGYNNESLITILEQISESYASLLDRWELTITDSKNKKKKETKSFFNYLGVGADAQAALQVHYLRESRPEWFFSRFFNKLMYGVFGAEDIIKASNVHTRKDIKLIADGVEVPLPLDSQGIILLNIDAYAGGVPLWSHGTKDESNNTNNPTTNASQRSFRRTRSMSEFSTNRNSFSMSSFSSRATDERRPSVMDRIDSCDDFQTFLTAEERYARVTACDMPSSCQDGILEVVSIRGAFHLGQIKVGVSNAQRLCQCREATIIIKNKVAVQVDGEPWRQKSCTLNIKRKKDRAVMLHRSADDGGVEMEMSKLLDWAEERNMINSQVHEILMKEFSRRIESKNRQKRALRAKENIMSTLKKAISSGTMANGGLNLSSHGADAQYHQQYHEYHPHNTSQWNNHGGLSF